MEYLTAKVIIAIYMFICQIDDTYSTKLTPRVINGVFARQGQYPFMVSLWYNKRNDHYCGGTIISNKWVLTAAHCLINFRPYDYDVVYGSATLCEGMECKNNIAEIDLFIVHEGFTKRPGRNDIALIKLKENLKMGKLVKWIRLNIHRKVFHKGTKATVMGWGRVEVNSSKSKHLKYANVNAIPDNYCRGVWKLGVNSSQHMCAGIFLEKTGDCYGDSGGPLIVGAYQVGIASFCTFECAKPGYPCVFTRVSAYVDWIYKKTGLKKFKHC